MPCVPTLAPSGRTARAAPGGTGRGPGHSGALAAPDPSALFPRQRPHLAHYLALRKRDIRPLQQVLLAWGLYSLGRREGRVLPNLDAVIATPGAPCGAPEADLPPRPLRRDFFRGERCLRHNARLLLGQAPAGRAVRIMLTLSTAASSDPELLRGLLEAAMKRACLNCAHDDPQVWAAMITRLPQAERDLGRPCRVLMDLAGNRIGTEQVTPPGPGAALSRRPAAAGAGPALLQRPFLLPSKWHPSGGPRPSSGRLAGVDRRGAAG